MKPQTLAELGASFFACLYERATETGIDPGQHLERLDEALLYFQRDALLLLGNQEIVGEARYLLSTVCDEWMVNSFGLTWTRFSLLVRHHGDARGGERCWETLDRLIAGDTATLGVAERQLVELYSLAIAFGWRGQYRMLPDGEERVHDLRLKLSELLHANDAQAVQTQQLIELSTNYLDRRQRYLVAILMGSLLIAVLAGTFFVQLSLNKQWSELVMRLNSSLDTIQGISEESRP